MGVGEQTQVLMFTWQTLSWDHLLSSTYRFLCGNLPSQFEKQRNQNNQDTPEEKRALALPRDGEGGCTEHTMVVTTKPPYWLPLLLEHEEG